MVKRGRPRLIIPLELIIEVVRAHGGFRPAGPYLPCSEAFARREIKAAGLALSEVVACIADTR